MGKNKKEIIKEEIGMENCRVKVITCPVCGIKEMDQRIDTKTSGTVFMCFYCGYAGSIENGEQGEIKTKFSKIAFKNKIKGGIILNPRMIFFSGEYIAKPKIIEDGLKWYVYKLKYTYPHPHFTSFRTKGKNIGLFDSLQEAVHRIEEINRVA